MLSNQSFYTQNCNPITIAFQNLFALAKYLKHGKHLNKLDSWYLRRHDHGGNNMKGKPTKGNLLLPFSEIHFQFFYFQVQAKFSWTKSI